MSCGCTSTGGKAASPCRQRVPDLPGERARPEADRARSALPDRCEKPFSITKVVRAIGQAVHLRTRPSGIERHLPGVPIEGHLTIYWKLHAERCGGGHTGIGPERAKTVCRLHDVPAAYSIEMPQGDVKHHEKPADPIKPVRANYVRSEWLIPLRSGRPVPAKGDVSCSVARRVRTRDPSWP